VVDRFDLWRHGAVSIWLGEGEMRTHTVADYQGRRPWSSRRYRDRRGTMQNGRTMMSGR
jgi:hypothetical protein